jgi:hypothetical protein
MEENFECPYDNHLNGIGNQTKLMNKFKFMNYTLYLHATETQIYHKFTMCTIIENVMM